MVLEGGVDLWGVRRAMRSRGHHQRADRGRSAGVHRLAVLLFAAALLGGAGCCLRRASCVPPELTRPGVTVDLATLRQEYPPIDPELYRQLATRLSAAPPAAECSRSGQNILVLSGGGKYGAYAVGVLNGWSDAGTRPDFDIVTGVSTGSLVAYYAFLGPDQDARARDIYLNLRTRDVYRRRPIPALLWADSLSSSRPLQQLIEQEVTEAGVARIAHRHAAGKRLFVGTTNLDTSRLTVWDMGAIASSRRPDRVSLVRQLLLASASVPGAFPPVTIPVTINGQVYSERHVDGGATNALFLQPSLLRLDPAATRRGERPLAGANLYIVVAGKLHPDPKCAPSGVRDIAAASLAGLTSSQARNDMFRLFILARLTGMNYRLMGVARDVQVSPDSLSFTEQEMSRLFDHGYIDGRMGTRWRDAPVGACPGEPIVPRGGTDFLAPVAPTF